MDIGNTGRALTPQEVEKYGLKSFPFAIDGVALAVHPDNPVSNLSPKQAQEIFAGKITNWKDVGGKDAPINLFSRDEASAATLSGGQQQRLCLARVLAMEPAVLLLDEPTASLDFRASQKIEELLLTLKEPYTILAVSHSLSQARRLGDQVLVFNEGRQVGTLERADLQQSERFQSLLEEIF